MPTEVTHCRICANPELAPLLSLGTQTLTGVFPRSPDEAITTGPLELVKCHGREACGLVQLRHSYSSAEMYGENYGYRSGLNRSMVEHLGAKVAQLARLQSLTPGDLVLDIGSNDGTLLSFYPSDLTRVGMDPTGAKFHQYYKPGIQLVPDFFSARAFRDALGDARARVVTSIAMFYDLEEPIAFMRDVAAVLAPDGIWHFEQSYLPSMLAVNAYDTVCHEHVEYYALHQIQWMTDRSGLKIIDVELNDANGGSFAVTVAHADSAHRPNDARVQRILAEEASLGLDTLKPYEEFRGRILRHREDLLGMLDRLRGEGAKVLGYGASTKGNVILQFCGLTPAQIPFIAEVNPDKFGRFTPGTRIPIISEAEAHAMNPDYLLVLPWHFRENLLRREAAYLERGGRMLFPLPRIDLVAK